MSYLLNKKKWVVTITTLVFMIIALNAGAQPIVEVNVRASDGVTYRIPVLKATSESNQRISIQEFYIKDGNGATVGSLDFGIQAELFSASEVAFNAIEVRQVLVDSSDEAEDSLWYELDSTAERINDWQGPIDQIMLSAKSSCQLASSYGTSLAFTSPFSPLRDEFADISGGILMFLALNDPQNCLALGTYGAFSTFVDELATKIVQVLVATDQAATKHTLAIEHGVYLNAQVKKLSTYVESETSRWLGGGVLSIAEIGSIGSAMAALTVYTISLWDFSEKMYPESYRIRQQRAEYVKENTQLFINGNGLAAFSQNVPTSAVVELLFGFENIIAEESRSPIAQILQYSGFGGFIFSRVLTRFENAREIEQYEGEMVANLQLGLEELNPLSSRNLTKLSAKLEQNLSYSFADVSLSVSASSGMANISGYIETTESAVFSGVVTFNLAGSQLTANVINTDEGLYFSRNFYLPETAQTVVLRFVSATGVVVDGSSLLVPSYEDSAATSPPDGGAGGGSTGAQKGTSLVFTEVVVRPSSEIGGSADTYQVKGHVRDDAGNNIDGVVTFTIGGTEYSDDLYAGTCGSSSSIDYCKGSFFVVNEIPKPFYTEQATFSVVSDDGQLNGQTTQLIAGSGGLAAGNGQISVPNPNVATKWRSGTTHNISYMATGIAPDERIRLMLYRDNGDYVGKVGVSTADRTTRFWQIPVDLTEGIYKIRVFQESDPSIEGWSSSFLVVRDNTPPVARDVTIIAVAGEQYLGAITAWDENDDELTFTLAQQPASGNTITLSGNTFSYLASDQYSGEDSFEVTVSDGESSTNVTVNIIAVSPLSLDPYELSSSYVVSPGCSNCMVSHIRTDGEYLYVMSDDDYLRKFTLDGTLLAETRFLPADGMDVGEGHIAVVSSAGSDDLVVFRATDLTEVWRLSGVGRYVTDLTIGEGKIFVSYRQEDPDRIKYFAISDPNARGGFAADGRYDHDDDDIFAIDFERGSGSASDIVLLSGGRSEDIYQWREARSGSTTAYTHGRGRWNERIRSIHAIGNSVYVGGHRGTISKFESSSSGLDEVWEVSSTNWVNDIYVAGGEVYTVEDGDKLVIHSEADGSLKQIIDLESKPVSVLSEQGVVYVGLSNGKLQKFSRNFIPFGTAEKIVMWSGQTRTTQIHVTDLDDADSHSYQIVTATQYGQATVDDGGLVRYTPVANFYGTDSVSVSISDGAASSVVTIPVQVRNRAPVAIIESNSASIVATVGVGLTLSGGGEDPEGDAIVDYEWSLLGAPENSSAELGSISKAQTFFTPEIAGVYTIGLRVSDGESYSELSTIELSVTNFAPQLAVASFSASRDMSSWAVATTTNKSSDEISSFSIVSQAQHGVVSISEKGVINYTPNSGYIGTDSFVFSATDVLGAASEFEVTFDVENSKPVALGNSFKVKQGSTLQATMSGIAPGNNPLSFVVQSSPAAGQFTLLNDQSGEFSFAAPLDYEGELSLSFVVNDGYADSDPATLTIDVTNATPSIDSFDISEVAGDTVSTTMVVQTNGLDTNVSLSYGRDSGALESAVNLDPLSGGDEAVTASGFITGLDCGVTYYIQLIAANASGNASSDLVAVDTSECTLSMERNSLVDLYQATGGDDWTIKNGWLGEPGTECDWFGVTCVDDSVTAIALSNNNLVGEIPETIESLINLKSLDLSANQLSGVIPQALSNLKNLESLNLLGNQLTGVIPPTLGNLQNLKTLYLSHNDLEGSIPAAILELTTLENLVLQANQLDGAIPDVASELSNLTFLNLSYNQLSGSIPESFSKLTNLEMLDLRANNLSGSIPGSIGDLSNLITLRLSNNQLSGPIPDAIGNLTKLRELNLINNNLSGSLPASVGQLENLVSLILNNNQISGSIPGSMVNLENLEYLSLRSNGFTGRIPQGISDLPKLNSVHVDSNPLERTALIEFYQSMDGSNWTNNEGWLGAPGTECSWYGITCDGDGYVTSIRFPVALQNGVLKGNNLTGVLPDELGLFDRLETLSLRSNSIGGQLPAALTELSNLTLLDLANNDIEGEIPSEIGNLANLQTLNFGANKLTGSIPGTIGDLVNLQYLHLYWNELTGPIPDSIGSLSELLVAFLDGNNLTGEIPASIGQLTKLQLLTLNENNLDGTIPDVFQNMPALAELALFSNSLVGEIPASVWQLQSMRHLSLNNNSLSGTLSDTVGGLTNLIRLSLNDNQLSGSLPSSLLQLTSLTDLNLQNNQFTGVIPVGLDEMPALTNLNLSGNQFADDPVDPPPALPQQIVAVQGDPVFFLNSTNTLSFEYTTSDENATLTGLGIRIHIDSSTIDVAEFKSVLSNSLVGVDTTWTQDTEDFDNNPATDMFATVAWTDISGNWPGGLPIKLFDLELTAQEGVTTSDQIQVGFSTASNTPGYGVGLPQLSLTPVDVTLDVDGNGKVEALTDALMIIRKLFGFSGSALIDRAVATDAPYATAEQIQTRLTAMNSILDVDGNGKVDALTDGLLIMRYVFGFRDEVLIGNAISSDATRKTVSQIESYLSGFVH